MTDEERAKIAAFQAELEAYADSKGKKRLYFKERVKEDMPRAAKRTDMSLDEILKLLLDHYKKTIDDEMPSIH